MPRDYDQADDFDDAQRGGNVQPHRGVMILVFGILGLIVCGVLGIVAWVMGKKDLDLISRGQMDKEGEALTKVGYILGIVGTILFCIQILFAAIYVVFIAVVIARK